MRFFFRSRQFKLILSITVCFILLSVLCFFIGGRLSPQADILGTVAAPFRAAFTFVSNSVTDFATALSDGNDALIKNAELENEINELREKLADYEKTAAENEFYKDYLETDKLDKNKVCIKCSKCSELMRAGTVSGCVGME